MFNENFLIPSLESTIFLRKTGLQSFITLTPVVELTLEYDKDLHALDNTGQTPIDCAATVDIINLLKKNGAEVTSPTEALCNAAFHRNWEAFQYHLENNANMGSISPTLLRSKLALKFVGIECVCLKTYIWLTPKYIVYCFLHYVRPSDFLKYIQGQATHHDI